MSQTIVASLLVLSLMGCETAPPTVASPEGGIAPADAAPADITASTPASVLNPAPNVPSTIPPTSCSGFTGTGGVWGPDARGAFVRFDQIDGHIIARYEDAWNGHIDPHCYDVTPARASGTWYGFSQGDYPYTYVMTTIDDTAFITRNGWAWERLVN